MPSESEFSKLLDVSTITVRKALSELVNEGVIYRIRGKGSSSLVITTTVLMKQ
ncbi:GntR family transcriptional regulator [Paenibacillus sp. sgz500992]|uniref:GntR family transcriptional regulator n=1 Tax=Paenibacillus sp. sgz500992 TaxID=3242476 RepID=UPI0036D34680